MKAKSIQGKTTEEINKELKASLADGFKPTLAFVFMTSVDEIDSIVSVLNDKQIEIFGTTTTVEFTDKGILENGISILLLDISPEYFKIVINDLNQIPTLEASRLIGKTGVNTFSNPGFIISGVSLNTPGESMIQGITEIAGIEATIIGGMAGEPVFFEGMVFTNDSKYSKGLLTLILDQDKIDFSGVAVSGWKPVGTEKTITECQDYWVKTIDNKPALEVLRKFMGDEFITDSSEISEGIIRLNTTFPFQVKRKNGNPIMRPTLLANLQENSILCGGIIEEGDVFRFSLPPDFEIIDKVVETSVDARKNTMPDAEAMIVFSCMSRYWSLGPMIEDELDGLAKTWNLPMAGFFCLGEFGKTIGGKQSEFHGTTCSWVALKEK
jgi:hypothetical protein